MWNRYSTNMNNFLDSVEKMSYYNRKEVWGPCDRPHLHLPTNMTHVPATTPYRLELAEQLMDLEDWKAMQKVTEGMID